MTYARPCDQDATSATPSTATLAPSTASAVAETAELLYGTALLAEGGALEDPARFAGLLADRLARTV
jgi:molecular chaperone HtpG